MSINWSTVPGVADGLSANDINTSIDALRERTDSLKLYYENLSGSFGTVFTDEGLGSFHVGDIIAWGGDNYVHAAAKYSDTVCPDGSLAPSNSSYVLGVLITEPDHGGRATVLMSGWITDAGLIKTIVGSYTNNGAYYLSAEGKASPGGISTYDVPVYCLSKVSDNLLLFQPKAPEYTGHSHGIYELPSQSWEAVDRDSTPEELRDSGEVFSRFDVAPDSALGNSVSTGLTNAVLTKNGEVVKSTDWCIADLSIFTAFEIAEADELTIYTISPLQGKDPFVHSIKLASGEKLLKLDDLNGNVVLSTTVPTRVGSLADYKGSAVLAIEEDGEAVTGSVIHSITAGPGIIISEGRDTNGNSLPGRKIISSSSICASQIDLQVLNLNGVLFGTESDRISFKFPAGSSSTLYGVFRLPHFDTPTGISGKINVILRGTGRGIPSGVCSVTPIKFPRPGKPTSVQANLTYTIPAIPTSESQYYYCASIDLDPSVISSDAAVACAITYDKPVDAVTIATCSMELSLG